jgi:hypothetical protein
MFPATANSREQVRTTAENKSNWRTNWRNQRGGSLRVFPLNPPDTRVPSETMTDGAAPEQDEFYAFHEVGEITFDDNGPARLDAAVSYTSTGCTAGQWLVDLTTWPWPGIVPDDASRFDAVTGEMLPESSFAVPPAKVRELAALIIQAAETAEFFRDGLKG